MRSEVLTNWDRSNLETDYMGKLKAGNACLMGTGLVDLTEEKQGLLKIEH